MNGSEEIIKHVGALSYFGIFFVSFIANVFVPVPEEIIFLALGYVAGTGTISPFIITPIIIVAALISDSMMFELSRRGNKLVKGIYDRFFAKLFASSDTFISTHIKNYLLLPFSGTTTIHWPLPCWTRTNTLQDISQI